MSNQTNHIAEFIQKINEFCEFNNAPEFLEQTPDDFDDRLGGCYEDCENGWPSDFPKGFLAYYFAEEDLTPITKKLLGWNIFIFKTQEDVEEWENGALCDQSFAVCIDDWRLSMEHICGCILDHLNNPPQQ